MRVRRDANENSTEFISYRINFGKTKKDSGKRYLNCSGDIEWGSWIRI
jgi:hypothetical protein